MKRILFITVLVLVSFLGRAQVNCNGTSPSSVNLTDKIGICNGSLQRTATVSQILAAGSTTIDTTKVGRIQQGRGSVPIFMYFNGTAWVRNDTSYAPKSSILSYLPLAGGAMSGDINSSSNIFKIGISDYSRSDYYKVGNTSRTRVVATNLSDFDLREVTFEGETTGSTAKASVKAVNFTDGTEREFHFLSNGEFNFDGDVAVYDADRTTEIDANPRALIDRGYADAHYGGEGAVSSVFGRTGAVTAQAGDYTVSQVTNAQTTALTSGYINVGDGTNTAFPRVLSGDATLSNLGALTIANSAVTNVKIANSTIDLTSKVTGTLPSANGGAGTVNGILKANGAGLTSAADASTVYNASQLTTIGTLFSISGTQWATASSNFTKIGTAGGTFTYNASSLTVANSANNLTEYITYDTYGSTNYENLKITGQITAGTISPAAGGIWIGLQSTGFTGLAYSLEFVVHLGSASSGSLGLYYNNSFTNAGNTTSRATITAGDILNYTIVRNKNVYTVSIFNNNTGYGNTYSSKIETSYPIQSFVNPNAGKIAIGAFGGTHTLNSITVTSDMPVGADWVIAGNSRTFGYSLNDINQRYVDKLNARNIGNFVSYAQGGNRTNDINTNELIALKGTNTKVIIDCIDNNLRAGQSAATAKADLDAKVSALVTGGYVVGTTLFVALCMPSNDVDVTTVNGLINTTYASSSGTIDFNTPFRNSSGTGINSAYAQADGIHPNQLGAQLQANVFINRFLPTFKNSNSNTIDPVSNNPRNMMIGYGITSASPSSSLDVVDVSGASSIRVSNSTTANAGGHIGSVLNNNIYFAGGAKYSGSSWVAYDATPVVMTAFSGIITFSTDLGRTVGNNYTPTNRFQIGSSTIDATIPITVSNAGNSALYFGSQGILSSIAANTAAIGTAKLVSSAWTGSGTNAGLLVFGGTNVLPAASLYLNASTTNNVTFTPTERIRFEMSNMLFGNNLATLTTPASLSGGVYLTDGTLNTANGSVSGVGIASVSGALSIRAQGGSVTTIGTNLGIGSVTATARLHLPAGTATANTAPQKKTAGVLLTTIEAGAEEMNASSQYASTVALNRYAQGGKIYGTSTDVSNTSTTETDLITYTTKANTLVATDQSLVFDLSGTFNDVTATTQLQFYFGGTLIGNTGALTVSATGGWSARVIIIRSGASTAKAVVTVTTPSASTASYTNTTSITGLTFSGTNIIKVTGTAAGAGGGTGDITGSAGQLMWWGSSNN